MAAQGDLAKRIIEKAHSRRSPLYLWLRENYADIAKVMTRPRPSWTALAETAAETVQVDDDGKGPNANSVRSAWIRVCRDLGKPHSTQRPTDARRAGTKAKPEPKRISPPKDDLELRDDPPTRHTFVPAKIR